MRNQPRKKHRSNPRPIASGAVTGNARPEAKPYVYGATGGKGKPTLHDTYTLPDGTEHLFTGKCHDDCEDVR